MPIAQLDIHPWTPSRPLRSAPALLAALVCAAACIVITASPASASALRVYTGAPGVYTVQPTSTNDHPIVHDLDAGIVVPAGTTKYLSSKLIVSQASVVTETSHLVYCTQAGSSTLVDRLVSGQNVLAGASTTILTRGMITAPSSGNLTCALKAIFIDHSGSSDPESIRVESSTYVEDVFGVLAASAQTYQPTRTRVDTGYYAASVTFTAPAGVTSIQAIGDVNVTTCYGSSPEPLCAGGRLTGGYAYVGTQLVVNQLNSNGSVCVTTTNGDLAGVTVTNTVHHFKINTWHTSVPVSAACTSRDFQASTRVTANTGAESIIVEANHQSLTAMFVA
ncbi:hypothetical protein AB0H43_26115 [Hamadaea sp. NPDC050747]|uniref:hypothetical protein n=1 Tax=Hamadaea sp. NPDC050747 TaxID=3155789 RepID=UPI0033DCC449